MKTNGGLERSKERQFSGAEHGIARQSRKVGRGFSKLQNPFQDHPQIFFGSHFLTKPAELEIMGKSAILLTTKY
jgi:hypothetical protein